MDAKDTWPVVKFLIAATGFKRRDARTLLEEIPEDRFSRLFVAARTWDYEQASRASEQLQNIIGDDNYPTLLEAARRAQKPVPGKDGTSRVPKKTKRR